MRADNVDRSERMVSVALVPRDAVVLSCNQQPSARCLLCDAHSCHMLRSLMKLPIRRSPWWRRSVRLLRNPAYLQQSPLVTLCL